MKKPGFSPFAGWTVGLVLIQSLFPPIGSAQPFDPILGPTVRIVSPADHAVFYAPLDIPLFAYTRPEPAATFTNLEFFAGTNNLGAGLKLGSTNSFKPPYGGIYFRADSRLGSLYCLVWTNAPVGSYALTAVASGFNTFSHAPLSRTSAPVNITILSSTTNSNPIDVVTIVATDPIAIAGTNVSWTWPGMTNGTPTWTNWPPPRWQYFTNWGPKAALFTVRRFGDASAAISVNYQIGGTASNGVDYATLPGFVNIPAGGAYGLVPIVPIDSGASNFTKTVVLTLQASTNSPADYVVGNPNHAAALIFYKWLRAVPWLLPDGGFHLNATGPDGAWFSVQTSSDLLNWTPACTNQAVQGAIDFVDPDTSGNSMQFYRPVPLGNAPTQ